MAKLIPQLKAKGVIVSVRVRVCICNTRPEHYSKTGRETLFKLHSNGGHNGEVQDPRLLCSVFSSRACSW